MFRNHAMNRIAAAVLGVLLFCASASAFFVPLTTEQRVDAASLIAVVDVTKVDDDRGVSEATVVRALLGSRAKDKLEIWDDWQVGKDGTGSRIAGRDPILEAGKRYLIYLTENRRGRWVTVQSSLDCLEVVGDKVELEGAEGFEPLVDKLGRLRALIADRKAERRGDGSR